MAAATQVPAGTWINKGKIVELIEEIGKVVAIGIAAGSDTVTVLLANLATERDAR